MTCAPGSLILFSAWAAGLQTEGALCHVHPPRGSARKLDLRGIEGPLVAHPVEMLQVSKVAVSSSLGRGDRFRCIEAGSTLRETDRVFGLKLNAKSVPTNRDVDTDSGSSGEEISCSRFDRLRHCGNVTRCESWSMGHLSPPTAVASPV